MHLTRVGYCVYKNNNRIELPEVPQCIDFYTLASAIKEGDEIKSKNKYKKHGSLRL